MEKRGGKVEKVKKIAIRFLIRLLIVVLVFGVIIGGAMWYYLSKNYDADMEAIGKFNYGKHTVKEDGKTMVFIPDGDIKAGFIFYQGGKVDHVAYSPLMSALAEKGVLCIVPSMPFDMAVFNTDAAAGLQKNYPQAPKWYIGGHSLGGAMAASYLAETEEEYDGLILLAAYTTADLTAKKLDVLAVYGTEDWVINEKNYIAGWDLLPEGVEECIIRGGNHAYFGTYGEQWRDGTAKITNKQQIDQTAKAIAEFVR